MPAIVLAYISIRYNLRSSSIGMRVRREKDSFQKKTNKRKEEINVANQFFPCRDMSRDLDIPWWHTYRARKSLHSQTKTKTFGPSSSKAKGKGKSPAVPSLFLYLSLYIYLSISNSPFYFFLFLSRSLVPLFLARSTGNILESTARFCIVFGDTYMNTDSVYGVTYNTIVSITYKCIYASYNPISLTHFFSLPLSRPFSRTLPRFYVLYLRFDLRTHSNIYYI